MQDDSWTGAKLALLAALVVFLASFGLTFNSVYAFKVYVYTSPRQFIAQVVHTCTHVLTHLSSLVTQSEMNF